MNQLAKVSYDKNIPIALDENEIDEPAFHLLRIVYDTKEIVRKFHYFLTAFKHIFLAKDRNEIINCLITALRKKQPENELVQAEDDERTHSSYSKLQKQLPDVLPADESHQQSQPKHYTPNIRSSYYEFQVFGMDSKGKLYPHSMYTT